MSKETKQAETYQLACHNFTDIRRHPLVIGRLDKLNLPFVVTMPQIAVGGGIMAFLFITRDLWGLLVGSKFQIFIFALLPFMVAKGITRTSFEGRSVFKAAYAFVRLWTAPRNGLVNGRRCRGDQTTRLRLNPILSLPKQTFGGKKAQAKTGGAVTAVTSGVSTLAVQVPQTDTKWAPPQPSQARVTPTPAPIATNAATSQSAPSEASTPAGHVAPPGAATPAVPVTQTTSTSPAMAAPPAPQPEVPEPAATQPVPDTSATEVNQ